MEKAIGMTAEELADAYGLSVSSIQSNFPRTQKTIFKHTGDIIEKEGRGKNARYIIKDMSRDDPKRAVTIFQSQENNALPMESAVGLMDINFFTFVCIVGSPQSVFRGSYYDLLKYMDIEPTPEDAGVIRQVLRKLADENLIMFIEDDSAPNDPYFMAGIRRKAEKEMNLEIDILVRLQEIARAQKRKSWVPLMKTYIAVRMLNQPCTVRRIAELTGLSDYKVRDCLVTLEENNVLIRDLAYVTDELGGFRYCIGQNVLLNAF